MRLARNCVISLFILAVLVNVPHSPVVWLDEQFALWIHSHHTETRLAVAGAIIQVGNPVVIAPLTLVVAAVVGRVQRSFWKAVTIVGAVAVSGVVSLAMKAVLPSHHSYLGIGRQPALAHMFPSSHTAVVLTLLGVTAVAVFEGKDLKVALVGCGILASLMIFGLAIGQYHWVSDIVGGGLLALLLSARAGTILRQKR